MGGETFKKEKLPPNQPKSISTEEMIGILERIKTHICKIYCNDGSYGTGFFCNIEINWNNRLKVLMTNNHVLNKNNIQNKETIKF